MRQHLLLVGDPGPAPRLLRGQRGAAAVQRGAAAVQRGATAMERGATAMERGAEAVAMTSLCRSADIAKLPGLRFVDRILATGPLDESSDAWVAIAVLAHISSPITQVAVLDPGAYARAAAVASVLNVSLYPRVRFAGITDHWAVRQRLRAMGYDDTSNARAPDGASLEGYVAEHGLPCLLRSRRADRPASLLRNIGDVDRAIRGELKATPGAQMLVERGPVGRSYRVVVLAESGLVESLTVLRYLIEDELGAQQAEVVGGPSEVFGGEDPDSIRLIRRRACELARALGVRDGLLLVDLGLDAKGVHVGGVRLGLAGEPIQRAVLQATGIDLALICARQCHGQPALERALHSARQFTPVRSTAPGAALAVGRLPWP